MASLPDSRYPRVGVSGAVPSAWLKTSKTPYIVKVQGLSRVHMSFMILSNTLNACLADQCPVCVMLHYRHQHRKRAAELQGWQSVHSSCTKGLIAGLRLQHAPSCIGGSSYLLQILCIHPLASLQHNTHSLAQTMVCHNMSTVTMLSLSLHILFACT